MDEIGSSVTLPGTPAAPERDADPLIGTVLDDRYQVTGRLGEGGMGTVYEATHRFLKTQVAIKLLKADAARDQESLERLEREARSASQIGSEHIVKVRDFGRTPDGTVYVAMERIEGLDLFKTLHREGPLPWRRACHVGRQLCEALGAAHARGIVHRDLKAENVLLCEKDGEPDFVKVVDFGIAQIEGTQKITLAGRVMGTPEYMSPEQCAGRKVDHRTDIYALGVLLFEMVTGRIPFKSDDLVELVKMHLEREPPRPSSVRPELEIPEALEDAILRCLAKRRAERFGSMEELGEALAAIDGDSPLADGRSPKPRARTEGLAPVTGARATTDPALERLEEAAPARRAPPLGLALGLGAAGLVALGAAAFLASRPDPAPAAEVRPEATPATEAAPPAAPGPEAPDEAVSAPAGTISLTSTPGEAEVYDGETLLGTTPLEVPRPRGDARARLEVRHEGYEPHELVLSSLTAASLAVTLERRLPATGRARPRPAGSPATAPAPSPSPADGTGHPIHREFRDPWAN